jgi:hypothetical protein
MANSSLPKKPQLDPALGYQQFEAILSRAERKISTTAPPLAGYPPEYVGRRLVQRIVELALYPCVQAAAANYVRGLEPIISTTYPLEIGGLRFHNDEVAVTRTTWLRNVADFCAQWLRVLAYLAGLNRNAISAKRATLLSGVGLGDITVDGSDARFAGFCAHGSLSPIHNASHLIVECAQSLKSTNPGWICSSADARSFPRSSSARQRPALFSKQTHCHSLIIFSLLSFTPTCKPPWQGHGVSRSGKRLEQEGRT